MNPHECFVCGKPAHANRADHDYFPLEVASDWFNNQPAGYNAEKAYVENHRPY